MRGGETRFIVTSATFRLQTPGTHSIFPSMAIQSSQQPASHPPTFYGDILDQEILLPSVSNLF